MRAITTLTILALAGCAAPVADYGTMTKDEAQALGGKSDGVDWCDWMDWYGDGVCDSWCPLANQDCSDDECTVGADSTCPEGQSCTPGVCLHWCSAGDPSCCSPATCEGGADFCPRALCAPGTVCNEETDTCDPIVCGPVLCALYCPYGFEVDEHGCETCSCAEGPCFTLDERECDLSDSCNWVTHPGFPGPISGCEPVTDEPDFCTRALCGPGTVCDEATDSCVPAPTACVVSGCNGEICADEPRYSACIALPEAACYSDHGVCEPQASGACGWSSTAAFDACMARFP